MPKITIYHNPRCSKSRQTLELIRETAGEPDIVEYLKTPPSASELKRILKLLSLKPRDLLRKKEPEYQAAGFDDAGLSDDKIIQLMVQHPKVIERPIVVVDGKAAVGRPPENVKRIL
jgi:arsenate reductase